MKTKFTIFFITACTVALFVLWAHVAFAHTVTVTASVRWNNENMQTTPHPEPIDFYQVDKDWVVHLADGTTMYGYYESPTHMRFEWEDALWWVVDGEIVYER